MHRIHQLVGLMLTMVMLGSSSGIEAFTDTVPPDPVSGSQVVFIETMNTSDSDGSEESIQGEMVPEQGSEPLVDSTGSGDAPEDQVPAEDPEVVENPSTGPPVEDDPVGSEDASQGESVDETLNVSNEELTTESDDAAADEAPIDVAPAGSDDTSQGENLGETSSDSNEELGTESEEKLIDDDQADSVESLKPESQDGDVEDDNADVSDIQSDNANISSINIQASTVSYTFVVMDWSNDNLINGATVSVTDVNGDVPFGTKTTVNGQAPFDLEPGEYVASVSAVGYFEEDSVSFVIWDGSEPDTHNVRLSPKLDGTYTIRVLNWDSNEPVVGATVAITAAGGVPLSSGETLADGVFTSDVLPAGQIYFTVSHGDYESSDASDWIEGDTSYPGNFFLIPITGGTITFNAIDAMSGNDTPLPGVSVNIESWGTNGDFSGTTDANGHVTFNDLPGGEYSVTANLNGYQERTQKLDVRGDDQERLPMFPIVEAPGTITLSTYEEGTGILISDVTVVIKNAEGIEVDRGPSINGVFISKELDFGTYTAASTKDGYHADESMNLYVNGDYTSSVILRKIMTGTATVQVVDVHTDTPIAGATVTVSHDDLASDLVLTSDSSGNVTFPASSFGYYSVDVNKDGYTGTSRTIEFRGDDTFPVYLRQLEPGAATITVRDKDSNELLAGVSVKVTDWDDIDSVAFEATTSASGTVTTPDLPEDGYRLILSKDGYFSADTMMTIQGDVDNTYYLETIKPGVITVYALTTVDVPIPGANVLITEAIADGVVWDSGGPGVKYVPGNTVHFGATDANGGVVSGTLESGSYIVMISADGYELYSRVVHLNGDQVISATLTAGVSEPLDPDNPPVPTDPAEPDDQNGEGDSGQSGPTSVLTLGFVLCANENCDEASNEYDGYTVSWTVTPLDTAATRGVDEAKMAAVGMTGSPVSNSMMQASQSFIVTGVLQNGVATGVSEPLLVGNYNVCLHAEITGPDGDVVSIAGQATCADLSLSAGGSTMLPFGGIVGNVIVGDPVVTPDETDGGNDADAGNQPGDVTNDAIAQSGDSQTTDSPVSSLPNTGAGIDDGSHGFFTSAMLVMLLVATFAFGTRRAGRRS